MTDQPGPPPSAAQASRDEGFRAWLAMNDYLVDEDFLVFDVEGMPDDPFTEEGLRIAEAEALRRFPDRDTAFAPENRELADKFIRFIGETLVRSLGGEWTNDPGPGLDIAYIGVAVPGIEGSFTPPTIFAMALGRRTGEVWATIYHYALEDLGRA